MSNNRENFEFGYYLTIFVDLLGQKELYEKIAEIPAGKAKDPDFQAIVSGAIRSLEFLKQSTLNFFAAMNSYKEARPSPPGTERLMERTRNTKCKLQRFSDGMLIFVPLKDDIDHMPVVSIYAALGAASQLMLNSLAFGSPIRGGIAIGTGIELSENELFGPVLARAYHAESVVAKFPRIVIDSSAIDYLKVCAHSGNDDYIERKLQAAYAELCLQMITIDADGIQALHYLGPSLFSTIDPSVTEEIYAKALSYSLQELDKHRASGNNELAIRYLMLLNYLDTYQPTSPGV